MIGKTSRLKQAELASGVGAGVLGVGLGVLLATHLRPPVAPILAVGAVLHGWGMWDKHHLEREASAATPRWAALLYWGCWMALLGLAIYIAVALS